MPVLDGNIIRIARKLASIQRIEPAAVVVPRSVALAFRELKGARAVAEKVLHRDPASADQFIARIGGATPLPASPYSTSRAPSPGAAILLNQAQAGLFEGPMCPGDARGNMIILQAAFQLDAALGYGDARLTRRAADYVQNRRAVLTGFEARLDDWTTRGGPGSTGITNAPGGGIPGVGGKPGIPVVAGGSPIGPAPTRLFPPGTDVPEPGDPLDPPQPAGALCQELGDLCIELFREFAGAAMADGDSQLIASVEPNCLCAGAFDDETVFTAQPDNDRPFPAAQGGYHLEFGGHDITDRIREWSPEAIQFTIPAGSKTGYVWLRRFANTVSAGMATALNNLCGIPGNGGINLPPAPRALITIVQAPVIQSFLVDGKAEEDVVTEACRAIQFNWSVHLADQALGEPLPPWAGIVVSIRDGDGNHLHESMDPIGSWIHNPQQNTTYRLFATSLAGEDHCAEAGPVTITVQREKLLYLEPDQPSVPKNVAGQTGTLRVRMSCPSTDEGATIQLDSSDVDVLRLPDTVFVLPGESQATVQFSTNAENAGNVQITARLADYTDAVLNYDVLQHLTAIVLSGGGAKGSFEVGALFYLREIWNDIHPRIVCGASVGAINGLAVAESLDGGGINTLETIWLGLQYPSDMYILSPEFQQVFDDLGISVPDVILHGAALPFDSLTSLLGFLTSRGVSPETAAWVAVGWAVGGPVGGLIGGVASLFSNDTDKINDAIQKAGQASYAFDLQPTQALIEEHVDPERVAHSGISLRLAMVALEDGDLYYVTEAGHLIRGRAANASFDEPITNEQVLPAPLPVIDPATIIYPGLVRNPLVAGTMASAAFPGIFQIRPIFTQSTLEYYMDGGVRQVLPMQAAVELGAQLIFAVAASPLGAGTFTRNPFGYPATLLQVVQRAIALQGSELETYIRAPREGFCDQVERVMILPTFEVHDTIAIDPGLIRINMAYGYFRAFDADQLRRGNINVLQYLIWEEWTDELIGTRMFCHQIENPTVITSPSAGAYSGQYLNIEKGGGLFDHDTLQLLRSLKNHIAELSVQRFDAFGANAFPRTLRNAVMGDQSALDWAGTWEIHPDPRRAFLQSINLWAPQPIDYGEVHDDPNIPPAPVQVERDVIPPFPIPDAVRNDLAAR